MRVQGARGSPNPANGTVSDQCRKPVNAVNQCIPHPPHREGRGGTPHSAIPPSDKRACRPIHPERLSGANAKESVECLSKRCHNRFVGRITGKTLPILIQMGVELIYEYSIAIQTSSTFTELGFAVFRLIFAQGVLISFLGKTDQ